MSIIYGFGIFIWLGIIAITIIGLIKPSLYKKYLKKFATRKYILIVGLFFFIVIPVALSPLASKDSATLQSSQATLPKTNAPKINNDTQQDSLNSTEFKQEDTQQSLPYKTVKQDDNSLASGQTTVSQAGVNGSETITYEVEYSGNKEISRTQKSIKVDKEPVDEIIKVGTYVAPASTDAPSVPSGATAQCKDGTYSYSQSRRGTCSHHGGVATWL